MGRSASYLHSLSPYLYYKPERVTKMLSMLDQVAKKTALPQEQRLGEKKENSSWRGVNPLGSTDNGQKKKERT